MTEVETRAGVVRGSERNGVLRFAGIPFAAPPTGERRFRAPAPHEGWTGIRDATDFGAIAPQPAIPLIGADEPTDEDCLFVNVWTPAADGSGRPVMVWIHGGAFFFGSGSSPTYDATKLVTRGDVVVVTLNYRLGAFGLLHLDTIDPSYAGSGNNSLLDQIAALEWVRDNIEAFGGDSANVTIFGESAGAMSVGSLLGAPSAKGLFHKAIAQSGAAHNVVSVPQADEVAVPFVESFGGPAGLTSASVDRIVEAQGPLLASSFDLDARLAERNDGLGMRLQPVADGTVLPQPPLDAVRGGLSADVPLLIGTNLDEWRLFALMDTKDVDDVRLEDRLDAIAGDGSVAVDVYREALPGRSPKDLFEAAATDYIFRQPAIRLAEAQAAHQAQTFMYLFTWAPPAMAEMIGSCHALEIPFVFGNAGPLAPLIGDDMPIAITDAMQESWLAFVRSGDPSNDETGLFPAYDTGRRATMEFGDRVGVLDDPESSRRRLWTDLV